ncbi:hypothetical protein [Bradyrhizobium sp. 188]|uniref:hypothetical protein n=1 Tax=Bradyrhizobium sp. 188 TaxID=2782656 RepID=UPI001FFB5E0B|nr:hypothetical protein [Bradyrhizobium sp. 188]MCK1501507.1 hypothetical protein [Bradyrhizobium sp. 188]
MMDRRKDCIDEILEAIGRRRTRKEVEDHVEQIDERAEEYVADGMARAEALRRATEETLKEASIRNAIARRNVREDAIKDRTRRQFYDEAVKNGHDWERVIEARLVGSNRPMFDPKSRTGNQLSAAALGLAAKKNWIGGVVTDLERLGRDDPKLAGLDKIFYSKTIEDDIFREKWQLDAGDRGKAGVTKNEHALAIAKVLHKWDKVRVAALNGEGAWISDYAGYMTKLTHDPDRIRRAARPFKPLDPSTYMYKGFTQADREAWAHFTLAHLDVKRTFGGNEEPDQVLAKMFGGFIDGSHMELEALTTEPGHPSIAGAVSHNRVFHWKSADDWLAYNKTFGRFDPTEAWLQSMNKAADHYALMKVFGSKPKEGFVNDLSYARNKTMGTAEGDKLNRWASREDNTGKLMNRFRVVSGEADRPIYNAAAGLVDGVMAVQRTAKLGFTPLAMIVDNINISRELARHGLSYLERNASVLSGYVQGAEGSAKAEVADLLHTGILGRLRGVTARFDISDARSGSLAWMENTFFKFTGITAMTENKRADAERLMAYALGKNRGKEFAALGEMETHLLQGFGIGDREWKLLHQVDWHELEGKTYLTPDIVRKIPDKALEAYANEGRPISEQASAMALRQAGVIPGGLMDRTRDELAMKLWAYFAERGQFAVIEPGAREKAMMFRGTQRDETLNLALRLLYQFKQFPLTMMTKTWETELRGGGTRMDKVAGITELIVGTTLAGMLANFLNSTLKGQDPTAQWRNEPGQAILAGFLRGGAASIYGDYLLGEYSRHGFQLADSMLGPTLGQTNRIAELYNLTKQDVADVFHERDKHKGSQTAAVALKMARDNTPFMNMIYTRAAFDYLVTYRLQEWLNPGYLQRMEQGMKQRSGIEFWLKPSDVNRNAFSGGR